MHYPLLCNHTHPCCKSTSRSQSIPGGARHILHLSGVKGSSSWRGSKLRQWHRHQVSDAVLAPVDTASLCMMAPCSSAFMSMLSGKQSVFVASTSHTRTALKQFQASDQTWAHQVVVHDAWHMPDGYLEYWTTLILQACIMPAFSCCSNPDQGSNQINAPHDKDVAAWLGPQHSE